MIEGEKMSITWVRQIFSFNFSAPNPCDKPNVRNGRSGNVKKNQKRIWGEEERRGGEGRKSQVE